MWYEINYEPVTALIATVGWVTVNTALLGTIILFAANSVETLTVRVPSISSPGGGFNAGGTLGESVYPSVNNTRISPLAAVPPLFEGTSTPETFAEVLSAGCVFLKRLNCHRLGLVVELSGSDSWLPLVHSIGGKSQKTAIAWGFGFADVLQWQFGLSFALQ